MAQRSKATDGTQAHRDLATIKNNINYWIKVHGMDREEAKKKVGNPSYKMMDIETINREIAAESKRQANLKARQEREEEEAKRREEEAKRREEKKEESKLKRQGGMKVKCNGMDYKTLVDAMCSTGKYDMKETKLRSSHWNKIRKVIQSGIECVYDGDTYNMN